MTYLIDTNVLIEAKDRYYNFERVPAFWSWMEAEHEKGLLFSVAKVLTELSGRKDELERWAKKLPKGFFLQPDTATTKVMAHLTDWASNHHNYSDLAVQEFLDSADYVLVAHGCAHNFTVISQEQPAPDAKKRIKLPDACNSVDVEWLHTFAWLDVRKPRF